MIFLNLLFIVFYLSTVNFLVFIRMKIPLIVVKLYFLLFFQYYNSLCISARILSIRNTKTSFLMHLKSKFIPFLLFSFYFLLILFLFCTKQRTLFLIYLFQCCFLHKNNLNQMIRIHIKYYIYIYDALTKRKFSLVVDCFENKYVNENLF